MNARKESKLERKWPIISSYQHGMKYQKKENSMNSSKQTKLEMEGLSNTVEQEINQHADRVVEVEDSKNSGENEKFDKNTRK